MPRDPAECHLPVKFPTTTLHCMVAFHFYFLRSSVVSKLCFPNWTTFTWVQVQVSCAYVLLLLPLILTATIRAEKISGREVTYHVTHYKEACKNLTWEWHFQQLQHSVFLCGFSEDAHLVDSSVPMLCLVLILTSSVVQQMLFFLSRLNVADIQETCQKNAASAVMVGRRDLLQVLGLVREGEAFEWLSCCYFCHVICAALYWLAAVKPVTPIGSSDVRQRARVLETGVQNTPGMWCTTHNHVQSEEWQALWGKKLSMTPFLLPQLVSMEYMASKLNHITWTQALSKCSKCALFAMVHAPVWHISAVWLFKWVYADCDWGFLH